MVKILEDYELATFFTVETPMVGKITSNLILYEDHLDTKMYHFPYIIISLSGN
jgi:hypothetical protein